MSHTKHCDKDCKTDCNFDVNVNVETKADACAIEKYKKGVSFPVDFNCTIDPKCRVSQIFPHKDRKGCKTGCSFQVDVDFDCYAKVDCGPCPDGKARYNVVVDTEHDTKCYLDKPCAPKSSSCSRSRSHSRHRKVHNKHCRACK